MDDYLCITLLGRPHETDGLFQARLAEFWTHMIRNFKDEYEKIYAEAVEFEKDGDCFTRQYIFEADVRETLEAELRAQGVDFEPIDGDDVYSKYEASTSEWFQIEH